MKNNWTALHYAVDCGYNETAKVKADQKNSDITVTSVQILMDYGADVNIAMSDGSTALILAAFHGNSEIVAVLTRWTECCSLCVRAGTCGSWSRLRCAQCRKMDSASYVSEWRILRDLKGGVEIDGIIANVMADVYL